MNCNYKKQEIKHKLDKKYFLSADFETTKIKKIKKQKFIVAGITDGSNFYYTERIEDFINLIKRFEQKMIYFHNLKYDFRFFIEYFNIHSEYQYNIIFVGSRVISFTVKENVNSKRGFKNNKFYDNNKILFEFRDSYALFPMKLEKVNDAYNKIYFKDIKYKLEEKLTNNMIKYLKLDCLSLFESLSNFQIDHINLCHKLNYNKNLKDKRLNLTISAMSNCDWQTTYDIKKIHLKQFYYDYFKKSMYGGRCEVYKRKGIDLNYYDFNSLYPAVMFYNEYPIGKPIIINSEYETLFHISYIKNIEIPNMNIPPVPYKDKKRGTIYPIGKIKEGVYNSIDLELFREMGVKYDFVKGYGWLNSDKIFKKYIGDMYPLKLQAKIDNNTGVYQTIKDLMNSLSGKFGQNPNHIQFIKITDPVKFFEIKKKSIQLKSTIFPHIYEVESVSKKTIANHILSFIYAYARTVLYKMFMGIENKGGVVYYGDTDSVFTNIKLPNHDTNLGELSLEYDNIRIGYFALPKSYAIKLNEKDIVKFKGFDVESIEFQNIRDYVENNEMIKENRVIVSTLKKIMRGSMGIYECDNLGKKVEESAFLKREKIDQYNTKPITLNE